jgi:type IV secretory pathway TrbF-like protein
VACRPHGRQNNALDRNGSESMKSKESIAEPEIARLTRYYEHDGMLRAYANRAMFLAILFGTIAFASLGFAIYVRIQPPTVIRVDKDGNATVVGGGARTNAARAIEMMLTAQAANPDTTTPSSTAPSDLEGKTVARRFLDRYLSYTPDFAARNLADALNMMTANLRSFTMNKLRDDDTLGKIQQDHIISELRIRSIERAKSGSWDYIAFAVKEIHKVRDGAESTDRIVGQYNIRLVEEQRSELNPSGLLVAEYSEKQMVGDRDNTLEQRSELDK